MLSKGQVNFETENLNQFQKDVMTLRDLGYSKEKVRKMFKASQRSVNTSSKRYVARRKMHKTSKTLGESKNELTRSLVDLSLVHRHDLDAILEIIKNDLKLIKRNIRD